MPKKEFTSFDIFAIIHELKGEIADSRVNNIYQIDAKTLLLKLHKTDKPPLRLVMEAGRRLHLTAYSLEKPVEPPAFCMALRKYLRNAWLRSVEQQDFERIVTAEFETRQGKYRLILELFGDGNIILTDGKGEILQAMFSKRMRDRSILRGQLYVLPPTSGSNPFKLTREELGASVKAAGETEVVRAIARSLGVGGVYAEEILLRAGIEKTIRCKELAAPEINAIFDGLQSLLSDVTAFKVHPQILLCDDDSVLDVVPFKLKRYESQRSQTFRTFNEALDEFYLKLTATEKAAGATAEVDELQREAERLKRVISEQEKALREAEAKAEIEKRVGDAIYAHSNEFQKLLDIYAGTKARGKGWSIFVEEAQAAKRAGFASEMLFESFDARNQAINVCVDDLRLSMRLQRTLFENAAEYYEHGKKAKEKATGATSALAESRRKLLGIEDEVRAAESATQGKPAEIMEELVKRKVQRKEWYEKFRWFVSSEGFLVVAGKDATSNEVIVKKHTEKDDVVFHADVTGAPFVIVKTQGKAPSEQTLHEAAEFAAAFSRAWREGLGSADIYWVNPDQLSKTGPSGEYVAHGAFAVVGKRNWLRGVALKTAVGIVENGELGFVGGPLDAVNPKAKTYVTVVPGDGAGKPFLQQVLRALIAKLPKEQRERIGKTSIEQIRELVPYTKGRLIATA